MRLRNSLSATVLAAALVTSACATAAAPPDSTAAIELWQARVAADPLDAWSRVVLGNLEIERARQTGDPRWYSDAEVVFGEAVVLLPSNTDALVGLTTTLIARHDFTNATELALRILEIDPGNVAALLAYGDASLSRGEVAAASEAYELLAGYEETSRALARLAHVTEVKGDPEEALRLSERALELAIATGGSGEGVAWYAFRAGDLHRHLGHWEEAQEQFEFALELLPNYPLAIEGLADVFSKTGRADEAISLLKPLYDRLPSPGVAIALGDSLVIAGRRGEARWYYRRALRMLPVDTAEQRVLNARERASLLADLGLSPQVAVGLAREDVSLRPDVFGYDVLAWAEYQAGNLAEARTAADMALQYETREPDFWLHAGLISIALGDAPRAIGEFRTALAINPGFDPVWVPIINELIKEHE